ncbi:MAG: hypothetical protein AAF921_04065 [Cyanobacteria bacterium P01_D01_bin.44]
MAKKSKGFGKLLKQEKHKSAEKKSMAQLEKRLTQGPLGSHSTQLKINPEGQVKMSTILEEFIGPELEVTHDYHEVEHLVAIAILAWNIALLPKAEQPSKLDKAIEIFDLPPNATATKHDFRAFLEDLISRKDTFFAQYKRHIVDFQVQKSPGRFHLSVASTMPENKAHG